MKLAVTYENGQIFQHFGHCKKFKIYEIADKKVVSTEIVDSPDGKGCAFASFLKDKGVKILICGNLGDGGKTALSNADITIYPGVKGDADDAIESFLAGTLSFDPDAGCDHHSHEGH